MPSPVRLEIMRRYFRYGAAGKWFVAARLMQTPYDELGARLPAQGRILDLGCGHGLLSLTLALQAPGRNVLGVDHDEARILQASAVGLSIPGLKFEVGTFDQALDRHEGGWSGIALIDSLHYSPPETQEKILRRIYSALSPGGTFLFREVDPTRGISSKINSLHEAIAVRLGFTQGVAGVDALHFRSAAQWEKLLTAIGFAVEKAPSTSIIFSDQLMIAQKPNV